MSAPDNLAAVYKAEGDDLRDDLERIARASEGDVRAVYLAAIAQLREGVDVETVRAWLAAEVPAAAAMDAMDWDEHDRRLAAGFALALAVAYLLSLERTAATYAGPDGAEAAGLSLMEAAAAEWADRHAAEIVAGISAGSRAAFVATVEQSVAAGLGVEETAAAVHAALGLLAPQADALEALRLSLVDEGVATPAEARAISSEVAGQLLTERAATIAETETWAAAQAGLMQSADLLQRLALLDEALVMVWRVYDEEACPDCLVLDGLEIGIGQVFGGAGYFNHPPMHPHCRCSIVLAPSTGAGAAQRAWRA